MGKKQDWGPRSNIGGGQQLAHDLRAEFPEMTGFSKRNVFYFRKFYLFYAGSSVKKPAALKADSQEGFLT
jgi:hypothetical protein